MSDRVVLVVTALGRSSPTCLKTDFVFDNSDCEAYGDRIDEGDVDIRFARAPDLDAVRLR